MIGRIVLVRASNILVVQDTYYTPTQPIGTTYADTHQDDCYTMSAFASALDSYRFVDERDRAMVNGWNRDTFRRLFFNTPKQHELRPNALRILARAVNCIRLCRPIRIPCWRRGRWKSLT